MAEAKNSFIKSKMNKDLDERLIPSNEYRDALNIAVSRSETSDVGALESIPGNVLVADAGVNQEIIGYYVDEANSSTYVFKTDWDQNSTAPSTAFCSIEVFNSTTNSIQVLVSGSWLNFSKLNRVNGVSLIENILFFTDNRNQPRKINVERAFSDPNYYFNEDQVSVAKFAPHKSPEFINLRGNTNPFFPGILPSTMSDASDPETTEIQIYEVSSSNLDVKKYRNGDDIIDGNDDLVWEQANTNQQGAWCYYDKNPGNGVTYGLLYNKWAVVDPRGLAPIGFSIPTSSDWNALLLVAAGASNNTVGKNLKSQDYWTTPGGLNSQGFNARPAGARALGTGGNSAFNNLGTRTIYWDSDAATTSSNSGIRLNDGSDSYTTPTGLSSGEGYSVRVFKQAGYNGWNGDPDFLTEKFARFSYRFKFDDNEYSVVAPWSQDVFIPKQDGYFLNNDENESFASTVVSFMENSINNAVLNIELPCIDIINNLKIKSIDILFKETDSLSYKVLETVKVDQQFIDSLNYTNIFQYSYESKQPIKTLPEFETTRVFDKVPVRALAQETAGNRVIYGNVQEGNTAPDNIDYFVEIQEKSNQTEEEYPQHHIKQNRNYQVGFVLADRYGRQTDIILSSRDGLLDENGDPQPGSNVFNDYKPLGFSGSIDQWNADNAVVNMQSQIPEAVNASNISGYPGAYAIGNYWQTIPTNYGAYFESDSVNYFQVWDGNDPQTGWPGAQGNTIFGTFLQYSDAIDSNNTLNVYVNETGDGWILKEITTDYTLASNGAYLRVTFVNPLDALINVKVELLFGSNRRYRYKAGGGYVGSSSAPLFDDFANTYTNYFAIGKYWSGEYIDYTNTTSVTPIDTITPGQPYAVVFETEHEINKEYLFSNIPVSTKNPPGLTFDKTFASYNLNPLGFYTYRLGIKQQQQDYYNVYLPGIVNGYPLGDTDVEIGEVAFTTLISDNINKVPRNLQDVGPLENQFTSDVTWFPRVENIENFTTATSGQVIVNKQVDPLAAADKVELIGTIEDAFPGVTEWDGSAPITAGELNTFCVYNYDQKPYIAKVSTRKGVGLTEPNYVPPAAGFGNYPYSRNMGLAVYETSPTISQLELFYETSTSDLISNINNSVVNDNDFITGIANFNVNFPESAPTGTTITTQFYPVSSGTILTNTTGSFVSVYAKDNNGNIDTSFNYGIGTNPSFTLNNQAGAYTIVTNTTFYAGQAGSNSIEPNYRVDTKGFFTAVIRFTQPNGTISDQTVEFQLSNSTPTVTNYPPPAQTLTQTATTAEATVLNTTTAKLSPGGDNGSATEYNGSGNLDGTNMAFGFPSFQGPNTTPYGWTIRDISQIKPGVGAVVTYGDNLANYDYLIEDLVKIPGQGHILDTNTNKYRWRFVLQMIDQAGNFTNASTGVGVPGGPGLYIANMKLTDTNNLATASTNYDIEWVVGAYNNNKLLFGIYDRDSNGNFLTDYISSSPPFSPRGGGINGTWYAQWINYDTQDQWVYARIRVTTTGQNTGATVSAKVGSASGGIVGSYPNNTGTVGESTITATVPLNPPTTIYNANYWVLLCKLDGANRNNNQKAAGVTPGQRNNGNPGVAYDFNNSAYLNSRIEFTTNTITPSQVKIELAKSTQMNNAVPSDQIPSYFTLITSADGVGSSPPLYEDGGSFGPQKDYFPTQTLAGGFIGPTVN